MKYSKLFIITTFIFSLGMLFSQVKPTVAILDFEGDGVDEGDVKTLT